MTGAGVQWFSHLSHLSAPTLSSLPARIMTCQCFLSSAISVVIWFLAISSFTRSRHLIFGLPRFRFPSSHSHSHSHSHSYTVYLSIIIGILFPSTTFCNIFLVASSLSRLFTCPTRLNLFPLPSGTCLLPSRCLHFSNDLVLSLIFPTATRAFQLCAVSCHHSF